MQIVRQQESQVLYKSFNTLCSRLIPTVKNGMYTTVDGYRNSVRQRYSMGGEGRRGQKILKDEYTVERGWGASIGHKGGR